MFSLPRWNNNHQYIRRLITAGQ